MINREREKDAKDAKSAKNARFGSVLVLAWLVL
jgi:hypothetical protein